jgi:transposase
MDGSTQTDSKSASLSRYGSLNPHPERVQDALFQSQIFFDPRDLVQVKYEMLRRVLREGQPPGKTAASFGFSRVTFYQVQERFGNAGLPGLLPQPKGPRQGYKLSEEVLRFLLKTLKDEPALRVTDLSQRVYQQFEVSIHPRSIERALVQRRKKAILFRQSAWLHLGMPPSCFSATKRSANRFCCVKNAAIHLTRTVWSWNRRGWQPGSRRSPPRYPLPFSIQAFG